MPKALITDFPITMPNGVLYAGGEVFTPKNAGEEQRFLELPNWRVATPADITAWSRRLQNDPALRYVRERLGLERPKTKREQDLKNKADPPPTNKGGAGAPAADDTGGAKPDGAAKDDKDPPPPGLGLGLGLG